MATYLMKYGSLETKVRANIWFQLFFFSSNTGTVLGPDNFIFLMHYNQLQMF